MDVNDMYKICQYAVNKAQNGYLTPSQFNLLVLQGQASYTSYLLGQFQQYQYGRPQARIDYAQNEDIRQRLTPLINLVTITIDGTGAALYPSGYLETDSMWKSDGATRIKYVGQDRLYSYLSSEIDPVATNPIYLIEKGHFQFYPVTLGTAKLSYVANPPAIVWGYSNDTNGRPVYNSGLSTQPVWSDLDLLEIIVRILKLVGLNLQIGQIEQYANQITQQGQ